MSQHNIKLDEGTKGLVEEVLNIAQRTVDIQYDDELADSMQELLATVAEIFEIQCSVQMDTGQIVPIVDRPNLELVSDNTPTKV